MLFHTYIKVESHSSKKNRKTIRFNKRNGKMFIAQESKEKEKLNRLEYVLKQERILQKIKEPFEQALHLKVHFHYPDTKKGKRTKRVIDLTNLIQGVEDCLESTNIIQNDKLIESYDKSRRIYGSKEYAVELWLYEFEQD